MSSLKILLWTIPAAMLIGVILILRLYMSPDPNTRLYNKYYEPLTMEVFDQELTRGDSDAALFEGVQYYLEGDYRGAIRKLETIPEGSFVLGLSLLSLKMFHADHSDHPDALWYLGLTCIRTGNTSEAKGYLEALTKIPSSHRQQVEVLISKIDKMTP